MTELNPERAWQQIQGHDAAGDGQFVYAVRTTGIYCRPSCPSRRPARSHVVLYPTPGEARAAGYRACKRCRPDREAPQAALVADACRFLDQPSDKPPTLSELGRAVHRSPAGVQKLFRQVLGVTPRAYLAMRRTEQFQRELACSETVASAVYRAGYGSSSRAYENSDAALGMTPGTYRKQGEGERIGYTIAPSPLGSILVAATARGLCAVAFGDTDRELLAGLKRDFAQAAIERDDAGLAVPLASVLEQLREHPLSLTLPLDVRATAFQRRVWEALQRIPRGETRSYGEVARAIGQPTAVRAVARACGQNPVAVVIPCHRVLGKNGKLTGYRWGVERKRRLLALEEKSALRDARRK